MRVVAIGLVVLSAWSLSAWASVPDHAEGWQRFLQQHVVVTANPAITQVDYAAVVNDPFALQQYLAELAAVDQDDFRAWPSQDQLAFLINAYNAWTVELIRRDYPLASIRELGSLFSSPWSKKFVPLFGEEVSLDQIEHGMIRQKGVYDEPRIHFAVNCASIGCPSLQPYAYQGSELDAQLEQATELFLADRTRNYLDGSRLYVSSIFKWYRGDFENGWRGANSLEEFLALYAEQLELTPEQADALRAGDISVRYLDYDWSLNGLDG